MLGENRGSEIGVTSLKASASYHKVIFITIKFYKFGVILANRSNSMRRLWRESKVSLLNSTYYSS